MALHIFPWDTTSKTIQVMIRSATTGQGLTGIAAGTPTVYYHRSGAAAPVQIPLTAADAVGTWKNVTTSYGWIEISAANAPGLYEISLPNAAIASGTTKCTICYQITGAIQHRTEIILTDPATGLGSPTSVGSDTAGTTTLLTRLPDALPGMTGGVALVGSAMTLTDDERLSVANVTRTLDAVLVTGLDEPLILMESASDGAATYANSLAHLYSDGTGGLWKFADGVHTWNIDSTGSPYGSYTCATEGVPSVTISAITIPMIPAVAGDAMSLTSGERTTLAGVVWDTLTSALTTVGSIGKWILDYLDSKVSEAGGSLTEEQAALLANTLQSDDARLPTEGVIATTTDLAGISVDAPTAAENAAAVVAVLPATTTISVTSPITADQEMLITRCDDYLASDALAFAWKNTTGTWCLGNLAGWSATWTAVDSLGTEVLTKAATIYAATAPQEVRLELTSANTALFTRTGKQYRYQLLLSKTGHRTTVIGGDIIVTDTVKAP